MPVANRLGRYELVRVLGTGGAGTVHEAILHGPGGFRKRVALKVLREAGDDLAEEARIGGLLRHPGLVEVYALEKIDGTWVIAMELVRGGSLDRKLPLTPPEVVDVGLQVCDALAHAHAEIGMVHLDIKPANLLIEGDRVKVADLGVSRRQGSSVGRIRGTPAYMAPEQRAGGPLDARADVWSLGITLLELATGARDVAPDALAWLAPVTTRCLRVDPNERFRTMGAVAAALRDLSVDGPGLEADPEAAARAISTTTDTSAETLDLLAITRVSTNIAPEPDAFVGRAGDLVALADALDTPGVLTLKGIGGLGKTRLARAAARAWTEAGRGDSCFVDLAECATAFELVLGMARALEVPLSAGDLDRATAQLAHAIGTHGTCVLVLDNLEQLATEAGVVAELARAAPSARFLCTSRVPLPLAGERTVELAPLGEDEAVELLVRRAADRGQDVAGDPALPLLARRLDAIPLALELAAGRMDLLPPRALLDRMDQRFKMLAKRGRDAGRQATLAGVIGWAWEQLDDAEQAACAQLSVFAGGFTLEAAEAVLALPGSRFALDVIGSLEDRSLVTHLDGRLRMYESTRAFAAARLDDGGAAERRHGAWFRRFGSEAAQRRLNRWDGLDQTAVLTRDLENIDAATNRAIAREDAPMAADLASLAALIHDIGGSPRVALEHAQRVLRLPGLTAVDRARMLRLASAGVHRIGNMAESRALANASWEAAREAGDPAEEARALVRLGSMTWEAGDPATAEEQLRRAVGLAEQVGEHGSLVQGLERLACAVGAGGINERIFQLFDQALALARAHGLWRQEANTNGSLGSMHLRAGDLEKAAAAYERALAIHRRLGDRKFMAIVLGNLGLVHQGQGRLPEALAHYEAAIDAARAVGDRRVEAVFLFNGGSLHNQMGRQDLARAWFTQALEIHRAIAYRRFVGLTLGNLGMLDLGEGRLAEARERYSEAREVAAEMSDHQAAALWTTQVALTLARDGRAAEALATVGDALEVLRSVGDFEWPAAGLCAVAECHVLAGEPDAARALIAEVEAMCEKVGAGPESETVGRLAEVRAMLPG